MTPSNVPYERMILYLDCEPFHRWVQRRHFGDRPRLVDAATLQPQIVAQPRRLVTLDGEAVGLILYVSGFAAGLRGPRTIALKAVYG
jgi:hypothetical protein